MKKLIMFTLVGLMMLATACATGDRNDNNIAGGAATGRYVEIDITPPIEGQFMSLLAHDGTIVVFDDGLSTRFDSIDGGESWQETPGPGRSTDRYANVRTASFLPEPDGRLLVHVPGEGLVAVSPDGGGEHFPVAEIDSMIAEGQNVNVSLIQVLEDNQLLLTYSASMFPFFSGMGMDIDTIVKLTKLTREQIESLS